MVTYLLHLNTTNFNGYRKYDSRLFSCLLVEKPENTSLILSSPNASSIGTSLITTECKYASPFVYFANRAWLFPITSNVKFVIELTVWCLVKDDCSMFPAVLSYKSCKWSMQGMVLASSSSIIAWMCWWVLDNLLHSDKHRSVQCSSIRCYYYNWMKKIIED